MIKKTMIKKEMTMDELRRMIATGQYVIRDIDTYHAIVPVDDYGQDYCDDVYHRQSYTHDDGTAYSVCISWGYCNGNDNPFIMMWINDDAAGIILDMDILSYTDIDVADYAAYAQAIINTADTMGDILSDDDIMMMLYRAVADRMRDIVDVYDIQWDMTDTYAVRIRTWREGNAVFRMPYIADARMPWDNGRSDIVPVDMVRDNMSGCDRDEIRINDDDIDEMRDISTFTSIDYAIREEYRDIIQDIRDILIECPIES